jgi:phosphoribosylformimino-5-aminoimidazole carboxamide ribotide isomerase
LLSQPELWPDRVVGISLDRVGTEQGPDVERLHAIVGSSNGCAIYAGGGVRDIGDLEIIAAAGASGALAATALHRNAITQNEIAAFLRRRRSEI